MNVDLDLLSVLCTLLKKAGFSLEAKDLLAHPTQSLPIAQVAMVVEKREENRVDEVSQGLHQEDSFGVFLLYTKHRSVCKYVENLDVRPLPANRSWPLKGIVNHS